MTIQHYLTSLCKHSGIDEEQVTISVQDEDDRVIVHIELPVDDSGLFIGFHGETLDSLQRMIRVIFHEEYAEKKLILNVNDYREQRQDKIKDMVINVAQRVVETGNPYTFSYLSPYERFTVHTTLSEMPEFATLESVSEGEGNRRVLTIRVK